MSDSLHIKVAVAMALAVCACGVLYLSCDKADVGGPQPSRDADSAGETQTSAGSVPADPGDDPLVNPPQLFEPPPEDAARVRDDETLTRLLESSPKTLNPIFYSSTYESMVNNALYMGPFLFDAGFNWMLHDAFVASFEEAPDHKSSVLRLEPGLKWHDGQPFTAHDIEFSWKAVMDDQVPATTLKSSASQLENVQALDDVTVRYTFKTALPTNKWSIYLQIIPKHIFDVQEERRNDPTMKTSDYYIQRNRNPVGNGPFRFVEWIENDRIVLERWDDFPGLKPRFKRVVFKIEPNRNNALLLFQTGKVDEVRLLAPEFATRRMNPEFRAAGVFAYASSWRYYYIGWNMDGSNPFFTDVRVRRAMAHAFDLRRFISVHMHGLVEPCVGMFHPKSWMFGQGIKPLEHDPAKAAALLDDAGWKVDPDDGWRYKDVAGEKVKFSFELQIAQGSTNANKVGLFLQDALKKVGVDLQLRFYEGATFLEKHHNHEFQAFVAGWNTGVDPFTQENIWHSSQYDGGRNYGKYSNERVDELLKLGREEFDRQKRAEYYGEIQRLVYEDQPYLFLWYDANFWAIASRIRGVEFCPRGVFNFYPSFRNWWVPQ